MTTPMMDLRALVENSADADLLREMIGFAAERLMDLEVGANPRARVRRCRCQPACCAARLTSSARR